MATNGDRFAIACRPFRHNRLPRILVKVLPVMVARSVVAVKPGLKPLKRMNDDRFAIARLKLVGFTAYRFSTTLPILEL